jgi:hypothetical protein
LLPIQVHSDDDSLVLRVNPCIHDNRQREFEELPAVHFKIPPVGAFNVEQVAWGQDVFGMTQDLV